MPRHKFYESPDGYVLETGETPRNMRGMVAMVWRGPIDDLKEEALTCVELATYKPVDKVPAEWHNAFAAATKLIEPYQPDCDVWNSSPTTVPECDHTWREAFNCILMFLAAVVALIFIIVMTT